MGGPKGLRRVARGTEKTQKLNTIARLFVDVGALRMWEEQVEEAVTSPPPQRPLPV